MKEQEITVKPGPLQEGPILKNGATFEYDDEEGGWPVHVTVTMSRLLIQDFSDSGKPQQMSVHLEMRLSYPDMPYDTVQEYPTSVWGLLYMLKKHQAYQVFDTHKVRLYTDNPAWAREG